MSRPWKFDPPWIDIFQSPCPWFKKQLTQFPQFPRLPKELQLDIWDISVAREGVNYLHLVTETEYFPVAMRSLHLHYNLPTGLLHACFNARQAALKRYRIAFSTELKIGLQIYFDFSTDGLAFEDTGALEDFFANSTEYNKISNDVAKVKFLQVRVADMATCPVAINSCACFPGIQELSIIEPDRGPHHLVALNYILHPSYTLYKEKVPRQVYAKEFDRRLPDMRREIQQQIMLRGGSSRRWAPPTITWGTETQYENWKNLKVSNTISGTMEWDKSPSIPPLSFQFECINDHTSLELAVRRKKRLLQKSSSYERHREEVRH
jgi:hypothetical protein